MLIRSEMNKTKILEFAGDKPTGWNRWKLTSILRAPDDSALVRFRVRLQGVSPAFIFSQPSQKAPFLQESNLVLHEGRGRRLGALEGE